MITSRKLGLLVTVAAALALTACAETSSSSSMTSGAGTATPLKSGAEMPTDTRGFVAMAASSDMFEIQSSQLAKSRNVNADVVSFADDMIRDHSATTQSLTALLAGMSPAMTPPTSMTSKHRAMLDKLRNAGTGDAFARAYTTAQVSAHQEAVALFSNYAQNGDNAALRQFAQSTLPTLQDHLAHAQRLNAGRMS